MEPDRRYWAELSTAPRAELEGEVAGPKNLGTFGASYLYPVFQRLAIIRGRN